jgi:hypothetical protein
VQRRAQIWAPRIAGVAVGLIAVAPVALGVLWVAAGVREETQPAFESGPFLRATWIAHHGEPYDNPRGRMVDDLLPRLRPGMTRRDLARLLGSPDARFPPTSPEEDPEAADGSYGWGYYAGPYYECIYQMVGIEFDRRGSVMYAFLHRPKDICDD